MCLLTAHARLGKCFFIVCILLHLYISLGEGCSHIAAVLFKVECAVRLGYTSSTSQMCKWSSTFCSKVCTLSGADLGGGGPGGPDPPLSYIKNDVMSTVIYAAFCMLPSLDFARLHIVLAKRGLY